MGRTFNLSIQEGKESRSVEFQGSKDYIVRSFLKKKKEKLKDKILPTKERKEEKGRLDGRKQYILGEQTGSGVICRGLELGSQHPHIWGLTTNWN